MENYACVVSAWVFYTLMPPWGIKNKLKACTFVFTSFILTLCFRAFTSHQLKLGMIFFSLHAQFSLKVLYSATLKTAYPKNKI